MKRIEVTIRELVSIMNRSDIKHVEFYNSGMTITFENGEELHSSHDPAYGEYSIYLNDTEIMIKEGE